MSNMNSPAITQRVSSSRPHSLYEQLFPEKEPLRVAVANEPKRTIRSEESAAPGGTQPETEAPATPHEYNDFFQRLRTELTLRGASSVSSPPPCALLC